MNPFRHPLHRDHEWISADRRKKSLTITGMVAVTGLAGIGAAAPALLSGRRPAVVLGCMAAVAVVVAVVTGWRLVGSAAAVLVTAATLLAAALGVPSAGPPALVAASALTLAFVGGLDRLERPLRAGTGETVWLAPPARRLGVPALAVTAAACVAGVATRPVPSSIWLAMVGLAAATTALVAATRSH